MMYIKIAVIFSLVLLQAIWGQEADMLRDLQQKSSSLNKNVLGQLWRNYFPHAPSVLEDFLKNSIDKKRQTHIFYFVSRSVPLPSIKHNLKMAMKLPKNIVMYMVFRGMDRASKQYIFKLAKWAKRQKVPFLIKIHPFLYRDLHIRSVPAFVIGECPKEFRYKECQYEYIAFGDMSLDTFLKDVGERDESYRYFSSYFIH